MTVQPRYIVVLGWLLVTWLSMSCVTPCLAMELPESPKGYSWKQIKDLKAALLIPDAWQFDAEVSAHQYQYKISKKSSQDSGAAGAGLTIVVRKLSDEAANEGLVPSKVASFLFDEIRSNRKIERAQEATQGPFETIRYQYICTSESLELLREYSLLVANDQTGTLYVFSFEAPIANWEAEWQTVTVVLDTIFLDDEI